MCLHNNSNCKYTNKKWILTNTDYFFLRSRPTDTSLQRCFWVVFGPYQHCSLSSRCPLVVQLLSVHWSNNNRTTIGQRTDNERSCLCKVLVMRWCWNGPKILFFRLRKVVYLCIVATCAAKRLNKLILWIIKTLSITIPISRSPV